MRVLLIADRDFATREHAMLDRLEVGLADDGVRVVRASPALNTEVEAASFGERLIYEPGVATDLAELRLLPPAVALKGVRRQGEAIAKALAEMKLPGKDRPIDVIHGFGGRCWHVAIETAWRTGASVVLDVWSERCLDRVEATEKIHAHSSEPLPLLWVAPDEDLLDDLRERSITCPTRPVPWGVHVPDEVVAWRRDEEPASIVLLSTGRDHAGLVAALEGIAPIAADHPDALFFLDAAALKSHSRIWRALERLGLVERVSLIADLEGRRELILKADCLIQPEHRLGRRSITFEAMAAGMSVVARAADAAPGLTDARTAFLVESTDADAWELAVRRPLEDRALARAVGEEARSFIRASRTVSGQISASLEAYRWMLSSEAVPFDPARR